MGMLLVERSIAQDYTKLQKAQTDRIAVEQQAKQWKSILLKYPDYRDGYYHLSLLEYELGHTADALKYDQQALIIDPNYAPARKLKDKL